MGAPCPHDCGTLVKESKSVARESRCLLLSAMRLKSRRKMG
ncbi:MAG: hypothetical protein OJF50_003434 [Nitrospira sp.]|nr:hypothetical protein [Nitrospira sp.]